jgi:hypothetical protein
MQAIQMSGIVRRNSSSSNANAGRNMAHLLLFIPISITNISKRRRSTNLQLKTLKKQDRDLRPPLE